MSLAILKSEAATVFSAPDISTMASLAASASNLFGAVTKGRPVISAILRRDLLGEALAGVEAGADRGAALGERVDVVQRVRDALDALLDLEGVAAELLAEGQRRRVLGVGAADLDDVVERLGLLDQRAVQLAAGPAA